MLKLKKPTLTDWIGTVVVLGVLFAIFYPAYASSRPISHRVSCMSHLKQLGTCFQIYFADFDDRMPPKTWHDEILAYAKNEDIFTCDEIRRKGLKWGYALNYELLGKDVDKVKNPNTYPMLFETNALAKDVVANMAAQAKSRHGRGTIVAHLDSSVKMIVEPP